MRTVLLDPYRGGPGSTWPTDPPGRSRLIGPGEIIDRAALAECRQAGHPGRWKFGGRAACADHLQDAIRASNQLARSIRRGS